MSGEKAPKAFTQHVGHEQALPKGMRVFWFSFSKENMLSLAC
jgi:hypothetical protein